MHDENYKAAAAHNCGAGCSCQQPVVHAVHDTGVYACVCLCVFVCVCVCICPFVRAFVRARVCIIHVFPSRVILSIAGAAVAAGTLQDSAAAARHSVVIILWVKVTSDSFRCLAQAQVNIVLFYLQAVRHDDSSEG